mgnify:CR=1 FL=1
MFKLHIMHGNEAHQISQCMPKSFFEAISSACNKQLNSDEPIMPKVSVLEVFWHGRDSKIDLHGSNHGELSLYIVFILFVSLVFYF